MTNKYHTYYLIDTLEFKFGSRYLISLKLSIQLSLKDKQTEPISHNEKIEFNKKTNHIFFDNK